jgi:TonB-dependent starch-binding outer membrane protein SusC
MAAGRLLSRMLLFLLLAVPLSAQVPTGTLTGRVTDAQTLQPLAGVTVSLGDRISITRDDGRYLLTGAPAGTHELRATRLGYATAVRSVAIQADRAVTLDLALEPEAIGLETLVAVGYGVRRAADVTGSVEVVTEEQFNTGRIVSPEQLIQGKIAGVRIIDTGEPGGAVNIRIRGGTSVNAGNEPLFVVDGIPMPHGGGLSAGRNPLNFLKPDDIESMTVLKDAASTAIYGSRGANGVILITTKRGSLRDPQFTYGNSFSTSRVTRQPDMLTGGTFSGAGQHHAPQHASHLGSGTTNWRDAVLQTAGGQEHSMAVSGAGETMNYRLSLGYLGQNGVVRGSQTERASIGINYNHRLFDERLNVQATLRGARTDDHFTPGGGLGAASIFNPTQPIRTGDGFFEYVDFELAPNNPIAELELGVEEGTTFRSIGSVQAEYRLPYIEHLTATARMGYDVASSERRTFYPSTLWGQQKSAFPGYLNRSNPRDAGAVLETFATYARSLERFEGSNYDVTAGYSYETNRGDRPFFEVMGLDNDLLGQHGVPVAEEIRSRLSVFESRLASFFGRVNYSHMNRYMFTASVRRDGSSRFGPANQWGTFPAAAVAWRLSEESFFPRFDALSDLRLRLSWGVNGNQAIGNYLWAPSYMYGDAFTRAQFGDEFVTTIRPAAVDRNIKWEETTSTNFALDYGFLNNRLSGSLEYYTKDTDDLLFDIPVAAGLYVSNRVLTNVGSVRNRGVEFGLNADVLNGGRGGLSWIASFNAARNANELLRLNPFAGGVQQVLVGGIAGGVGSTIQVLRPGQPVNTFYVYRHKRDESGRPIYSNNLLEMYEDQPNAEGVFDGAITPDDRVAFESPAPRWMLGHTSSFGLRNVDLGFTLRAHLGNHVYNNLASSQGFYRRLTEASGPVNLHASVLENSFVEAQYFSDVYVEDASFLRMDNITLGYRLPRFRGAQQLRVFGAVQNVFTLTGYSGVDPEVGLLGIDNNIYPRSRTFSVGANVGF